MGKSGCLSNVVGPLLTTLEFLVWIGEKKGQNTNSSLSERIFFCLPSNWNINFVPAFGLSCKHWLYLGLWSVGFVAELHHWLCWFSGTCTRIGTIHLLSGCWLILQISGIASLHKCMAWFLIINLYISVCAFVPVYPLLALFSWRTPAHHTTL